MKKLELLNKKRIVSIDAESNGLWGQPFAVAAVVYDEVGNEIDRFVGRCPIEEDINSWVAENVIPEMKSIEITHATYGELLDAFFGFASVYYKNEYITLTHMGHIVEARLLQDAHEMGIIGDWDAPYEWFDCCLFFGDSVDTYNTENGIVIDDLAGGTHNPLYDCIAAYKAFKHFVSN